MKRLLPCLLLPLVLRAAEAGPLQADIKPLVLRPRANAPLPVEVTLHWQGAGLLEGRLEIRLELYGVLSVYRTSELALPPGVLQTTRWLLPPQSVDLTRARLEAVLRFLPARGSPQALGRFPLFFGGGRARQALVIGHVRDTLQRDDAEQRLVRSLWIERFYPRRLELAEDQPFQTLTSPLAPEDCPAQPLHYCAYDLLLVSGPALARLSSRQLDALTGWLRAGGAALLAPSGALPERTRAALQALIDQPAVRCLTDHRGGLLLDPAPPGGIGRYPVGLGRLLLLPDAQRADLDSPGWGESIAWLWRIRAGVRRQLARNGGVFPAELLLRSASHYYDPGGQMEVDPLRDLLMPADITPVPPSLVLLILLLFVLAIGPLDYFVLGKLGRRKWTWITFPLLSLGFTALTVALSEGYLGRSDHRRALHVVDVGRGGRVLRSDRFELVLLSRGQSFALDGRGRLIVPLGGQRYFDGQQQEPAQYEGRLPGAYRLTRDLAKWSPWLYRSLAAGGQPELPALRWDAVAPALFRTAEGRGKIPELLAGGPPPAGIRVMLLHGNLTVLQHGRSESLIGLAERYSAGHGEPFGLLCAIAPRGGPALQDLAVFDPSDPTQWLLLVALRRGDELLVMRRLYHLEPP